MCKLVPCRRVLRKYQQLLAVRKVLREHLHPTSTHSHLQPHVPKSHSSTPTTSHLHNRRLLVEASITYAMLLLGLTEFGDLIAMLFTEANIFVDQGNSDDQKIGVVENNKGTYV